MNNEAIFKESDRILEGILKILNLQREELNKRGLQPQRVYDVKQGQVLINGIYIPFSSIDHKILIDGYELTFTDDFIALFNSIYKNRDNPITQFALRTITEMGFQRCQILFSKTLSKAEIETYKLVIMLGDYGFMSPGRPEHARTFKKLLSEKGSLLTENQKNIFLNFIDSVEKNDETNHRRFTKKARKLADSIQDQLYRNTPILPLYKTTVINSLFDSFSHILHGNILLILDIFSSKRPSQLQLRVYWVLLLSGVNMVNHISQYLGDNKIESDVKKLNLDFGTVAKNVQTYWAKV